MMEKLTFHEPSEVSLAFREQLQDHKAAVVWLTGLSGAGKSTLGRLLERALFQQVNDRGSCFGLVKAWS